MSPSKSKFSEFVQDEIKKYKGVAVPVKAGLPERLLVRKLPVDKLHPNPEDEFCDPEIGPNDEIIARYVHDISEAQKHTVSEAFEEPLMVEKMEPDGYMLMNGHHRWAAAKRMSMKKVPVKIVNLTSLSDVEKMLKSAKNDIRVTLDLDEVVFLSGEGAAEKALPFPLSLMYKERLRLGIPALFHFFHTRGYDIWVYSSSPYSMDYVRSYFRAYRARLDGIITGSGIGNRSPEEKKQMEALIASHYAATVHVDLNSVVRIERESKQFRDYPLSGTDESWSREVMDVFGEMKRNEK